MVNTKERVLRQRHRIGPKNVKRLQTIAYTEDKVPVYNLCISEMPRNLKLAHVRKHFSKFGELKNVEILHGKTRSAPTQCIIRYQNAEAAGVAVMQRIHKLNYHRIIVKASPSWEQPFQNQYGEFMNNNYTNLLTLNDYCLEMIFQKLDLLEQIRLSLCHPRLEWIFVHMIGPRLERTFCFDLVLTFTEWEFRQFFYTVGEYVETIILGPKFQRNVSHLKNIYSFMQECCLHAKHIFILYREPKQYEPLLNSLQLDYIISLDLYKCNLRDTDLEYLRKLRNLKELGLGWNYHIKGTVLKDLHKLEQLVLCGCDSITNEALTDCCKNVQLKLLDIRIINSVSYTESAVQYCTSLETLKTTSLNVDVAKLPNLKSLHIRHQNSERASRFYEALLEYHQHDLLELILFGEVYLFLPTAARFTDFQKLRTLSLGKNALNVCSDVIRLISNLSDLEEIHLNNSIRIRDKHLLSLISKCTKLKRMNIRKCRYITNNFIWQTIITLKKRAANTKETEKKQPLIILVNGTRIKRNILESAAYKKNCHLLKLLFHNFSVMLGSINEGDIYEAEDHKNDCSCGLCRKANESDVNEWYSETYDEYYYNMSGDDDDDDEGDDNNNIENMIISMQ